MNNRHLYLLYILSIFAVIVFVPQGCYYDNEVDLYGTTACDTTDVTYSAVVLPIIESACYSCHDDANNFGGISLEGHAKLKASAESGGLLGTIRRENGWLAMPINQGPLPDCDVEKIAIWVAEGAPNN